MELSLADFANLATIITFIIGCIFGFGACKFVSKKTKQSQKLTSMGNSGSISQNNNNKG